ncbi:MAG: helix-turn-helix domain-containing protein [Rhodocyclaceae bacterium]|jgi:transcriptional regulator GlxA family with amidase domain|nr:MAG: helix-turn-helix domain-containing protein [Rhodocyclaceae bacterium]
MHDFTVVVLDGAFASGVCATRDILAVAALLAPQLAVPRIRWRLCSPQGGAVALDGGVRIDTERLPAARTPDDSTWVIPGLMLTTPAHVNARLVAPDVQALLPRLARHAQRGGRVAAACSAVFLLQAAGLLERRRVTTTWWLAPHLESLAPGARVDVDRVVCTDGPLTTAGTAFSQIELTLHLLRERYGPALAERTASLLAIQEKTAQTRFIVPEVAAGGDALVLRLAQRIEAALPACPSVAELAAECAMSPRTLSRRIRSATGRSTLALVQAIRLRRAKYLLESSRLPIDQIAAAVGYTDATALRRLIRRRMGARPRELR